MKKDEPKTLFEHLGLKTNGNGPLSEYKVFLTSTIRLMAIGFLIGLILDIILDFDKFSIVIPIIMLIIAILKKNTGQ